MQPMFRNAMPDDAPAMSRLLVQAWQKAYRGILSDAFLDGRSADAGSERLRNGIETKPEFRYYVLEEGQTVAGVSVVCPCGDADLADAAEIMVFYIHPDWQGLGLGRLMMERTLETIRASGVSHVALWVFRDNRNARAFYEKMGFRFDGAEKTMPHHENAVAVRYRYHGEGALP